MPPSHRPSLRGPRGAPPLSAIEHSSPPPSRDDGLFLPSSCHSRTWLLDRCGEEPRGLEPEPCPRDGGVPRSCLPAAVRSAGSHASTRERTTGPSGGSSAECRRESQPCAPACSLPAGFAIQSCPPGGHGAQPCPSRTDASTQCPAPECGPSQGRPQDPGPRPCRPPAPGTPSPQPPGPSADPGEPPCCVTGGWGRPRE
ncbi:keratin-associated protein 27-1 [Phyllostomus hastatus]|uniref:keratin-associated protein 27-1 n=1 Tax=Phyllostomus hastatus TaxID=9423 RepID=UPI001E682543|nr:keratin-associated protein 27-1 [Phyllostomus hastatus]